MGKNGYTYTSFIDEKVEYFEKYGAYRRFLHHKKCNN